MPLRDGPSPMTGSPSQPPATMRSPAPRATCRCDRTSSGRNDALASCDPKRPTSGAGTPPARLEDPQMPWPTIPEDLSAVGDDELAALEDQLVAAFTEVSRAAKTSADVA